jgi:hypothetical protein
MLIILSVEEICISPGTSLLKEAAAFLCKIIVGKYNITIAIYVNCCV